MIISPFYLKMIKKQNKRLLPKIGKRAKRQRRPMMMKMKEEKKISIINIFLLCWFRSVLLYRTSNVWCGGRKRNLLKKIDREEI